jgi:hypothetical protein
MKKSTRDEIEKKYLISLIILNKKNELRPNLKENNLRG